MIRRLWVWLALLVPLGAQAGETGEEGDGDERQVEIVPSPFEAEEAACVEGDAAACLSAGLKWAEGAEGQQPSVIRAESLLRAACVFEEPRGCTEMARRMVAMEMGLHIAADSGRPIVALREAAELYERACHLGDQVACVRAGDLWLRPEAALTSDQVIVLDMKQDLFRGQQLYERGCPLAPPEASREARACQRMSELYELGVPRGGRRLDLAARYAEFTCELLAPDGPCERADELRERAAQEAADPDDGYTSTAKNVDPMGVSDRDLANPDVERFGQRTLRRAPQNNSIVRIDALGTVGARWTYTPRTLAGLQLGFGLALWFDRVGITLESAFVSDEVPTGPRTYSHFLHSLGVKFAVPLPVIMPLPSRLRLQFGVAGIVGNVRFHDGSGFRWSGGVKEQVELILTSPQDRGARFWWGVRVEQQQVGWAGLAAPFEHSTQALLIAGLTGGGLRPGYPGGAASSRRNAVLDPLSSAGLEQP